MPGAKKDPSKERINFPPNVKKTACERAGHRCGFIGCLEITAGPGADSDDVSRHGDAAHIYSASANGPRGQGGLTEAELASIDNALWVCANHAREIDTNRGKKYPAELLLAYKQLHEARIAKERKGLYSPLGWVYEIRVSSSMLFKPKSALRLAKMTLITGDNSSGKSALCDWIQGVVQDSGFKRWINTGLRLEYTIFAPNTVKGKISVDDFIAYKIGGVDFAFNPLQVRVIRPRESPRQRGGDELDELENLARIFGISTNAIRGLARNIDAFEHAHARNLRFVEEDGGVMLRVDLQGTVPGLTFGSLSGREQETVLVEFATAYARESSAYTPTILLLDSFVSIFFKGWFDFFSHHFLDSENNFQTILTLPTQRIELDRIVWNGWDVVRLVGKRPDIEITQN